MTLKSSFILAATLTTLTSPAFAQLNAVSAETDLFLLQPRAVAPLLRVTQTEAMTFNDMVIEIGDTDVMNPTIIRDDQRIFTAYSGTAPLDFADRAMIEAEIEARFNRNVGLARPQTGLIFEPDLSMFFKPLEAAGKLKQEDIFRP